AAAPDGRWGSPAARTRPRATCLSVEPMPGRPNRTCDRSYAVTAAPSRGRGRTPFTASVYIGRKTRRSRPTRPPSAPHHGVRQLVGVVRSGWKVHFELLAELCNDLEDTVRWLAVPNALDEVRHLMLPPGITDPLVDAAITKDDDTVLELGNQQQDAGAVSGFVDATLREELKRTGRHGLLDQIGWQQPAQERRASQMSEGEHRDREQKQEGREGGPLPQLRGHVVCRIQQGEPGGEPPHACDARAP